MKLKPLTFSISIFTLRFYRRRHGMSLVKRLSRSVDTTVYPTGCPDYDYIYVFPTLDQPVKGSRVEGQVIENVYSWQECGKFQNFT